MRKQKTISVVSWSGLAQLIGLATSYFASIDRERDTETKRIFKRIDFHSEKIKEEAIRLKKYKK